MILSYSLPSFNELCAAANEAYAHVSGSPRAKNEVSKDILLPNDSKSPLANSDHNHTSTSPNGNYPNDRNYILTSGGPNSRHPSTGFSTSSAESLEILNLNDNNDYLHWLISSIEEIQQDTFQLGLYMNKIHQDLSHYVDSSVSLGGVNSGEVVFNLKGQYEISNRSTASVITRSNLQEFFQTIPLSALYNVNQHALDATRGIERWIQYRERQLENGARIVLPHNQTSNHNGNGIHMNCTNSEVETASPTGTDNTVLNGKSSVPISSSSLIPPPNMGRPLSEPTFNTAQHQLPSSTQVATADTAIPAVSHSSIDETTNDPDAKPPLNATTANFTLAAIGAERPRTCHQCSSSDTPEWRRGPHGPRSLCNACGLFYGKLSKKFGKEKAAKIMEKRKVKGDGCDRRIPTDQ